jgi:hypothetical protein
MIRLLSLVLARKSATAGKDATDGFELARAE